MNSDIQILRDDRPAIPDTSGTVGARSPLKAVRLLLPVWGQAYINQFLEYSLPTLMAPGNVPALAQELPCEFEFLTSADDERYLQEHPAYGRLSDTCTTTVRHVDHLITAGNYSTIITLAYAEAVRARGAAMLDTCFVFLVSDFIMADGSLKNVLSRIRAGNDAVLVGNFQVTAEDALPALRAQMKRDGSPLSVSSRELLRWALPRLHPTTVANIVNNPLGHNSHTNRLFWRLDASTLLGRFYLLHMIAIRPEVLDFQVGSSCDYSFVPEMCPSGNVCVIDDSDDYLVVEAQPAGHEARFFRTGAITSAGLAESLNEWTTDRHRENVRTSIVFHAGETPAILPQAISAADSFIEEVSRNLDPRPQPHRVHPYWTGAIAAFKFARGQELSDAEKQKLIELGDGPRKSMESILSLLCGRRPHVRPWHPRWPDYRLVLEQLAPFLADKTQRLLAVSNYPTPVNVMLSDCGERVCRLESDSLLKASVARHDALQRDFDICLLQLSQPDLPLGRSLVDRLVPLMKDGGKILLVIESALTIEESLATLFYRQMDPGRFAGAWVSEMLCVPESHWRSLSHRLFAQQGSLARQVPVIGIPALIMCALPVAVMTLLTNLCALSRPTKSGDGQIASTLLLEATIERRTAGTRTSGVHEQGAPHLTGGAAADLGFVASIVSGCRDVAAVSCGDIYDHDVVLPHVGHITCYDKDAQRRRQSWSHHRYEHDIVRAPLPRHHDAIYSLDLLGRLGPGDADLCLMHLADSLPPDGVLLVGTATADCQWESEFTVRSLLHQYFHSVFLFALDENGVLAGHKATARYLYVLCANKKDSSTCRGLRNQV